MKRNMMILMVPLFLLSTLWASGQEEKDKKEKKKPEHYAAVVVGTGGAVAARSTQLDIYINDYSTDEEVAELRALLMEKGQDALRRRLEKIKKGRIAPTGRIGNDVAVIRAFPTENGKKIALISARIMPFLELYMGGRSTDYNLSWILLDLDEEGKGTGSVIVAADMKFNDQGQLVVESYGLQYLKLVNVRRYN